MLSVKKIVETFKGYTPNVEVAEGMSWRKADVAECLDLNVTYAEFHDYDGFQRLNIRCVEGGGSA